MRRTDRGFPIYTEFTDTCGSSVRLQMSSSACARRAWIFCHRSGENGEREDFSPHLSVAQAIRLARALLRFAEVPRPATKPRAKRRGGGK